MKNGLTEADVRRSRWLCYVAAGVFGLSGVLLFFAPLELALPVRWVLTGFHGVVAVAVFLYGAQLKADS